MVACRHLGEPVLCLHTAALWIIYCGFKKNTTSCSSHTPASALCQFPFCAHKRDGDREQRQQIEVQLLLALSLSWWAPCKPKFPRIHL